MINHISLRQWSSLFSLLFVLGLTACSKPAELTPVGTTGPTSTPVSTADPTKTFDPTGQKLLGEGEFTNGVHTTKGTAKIYEKDGKRTLVFSKFSTDAGPDLRIYIAEDKALTNFIEVSKLTNTGDFFVELPDSYAPSKQKSVLIWCKAFAVLFGSATLK